MKTDNEANLEGIDNRDVVSAGIKELMIAFGEMVESHGAHAQFETAKLVWVILDNPVAAASMQRSQIDKTRTELVAMRDGLLVAAKFDWAVLCTHAIWWLSVMLEE